MPGTFLKYFFVEMGSHYPQTGCQVLNSWFQAILLPQPSRVLGFQA